MEDMRLQSVASCFHRENTVRCNLVKRRAPVRKDFHTLERAVDELCDEPGNDVKPRG